MRVFDTNNIKYVLFLILVIATIFSISGCITKRAIQSDDPLKYEETVARYVKEYGNDYVVKQMIKSSTPYEIITWPSKGISITSVMETGVVTSVETFNPNSGHVYMNNN